MVLPFHELELRSLTLTMSPVRHHQFNFLLNLTKKKRAVLLKMHTVNMKCDQVCCTQKTVQQHTHVENTSVSDLEEYTFLFLLPLHFTHVANLLTKHIFM